MTTGKAAAATSPKVGATFSNRLQHMESMSLHPSGIGRISHLNVVILGEPLESEENDLVFPSQEFFSQAIGYNFDYNDFHSFVHGRLPYETLKPDPVISQLLVSLPVRKVIFTNGDQAHAAKVLKKLDLEDCFDTVMCFETLNPSSREDNSANIFDIIGYLSKPDPNGAIFPLSSPSSNVVVLCHDLPLDSARGTGIRLFLPSPSLPPTGSKLPVIVYIHSGGFIIFRVASSPFHGLCSRLAASLPAVVLSVDYHLSPGHRLPLPLRTPSSGSGPTPWGRLRRETSPSCSLNAPTSPAASSWVTVQAQPSPSTPPSVWRRSRTPWPR
ncbi:hypothetical protein ZIOFF_066076 [Zingiber officinale]|uniref:Alpha/beta hydrolase fold-3 domain-containing protein n=1 Tax=Zingiber officinale TaxID=94328 RepID=A0A8J5F2X8_ZINOF|nr:hypothetical protein ZIOFF_066076 [Zingiber officinale]